MKRRIKKPKKKADKKADKKVDEKADKKVDEKADKKVDEKADKKDEDDIVDKLNIDKYVSGSEVSEALEHVGLVNHLIKIQLKSCLTTMT